MPTSLQYPLGRHRGLERRWKLLLEQTPRPSVGNNTMPPRDPDDDYDDDEAEEDEEDEEDEDQHEEPPVIREPDE